jgi:transcription initiation factor TFIIIB Brf1 subunit/transcription initiation factor TFIIB
MVVAIKPFERNELHNRLLEEHRAIAAKLELPERVKEKSLKLLREITPSGKKPKSVAAACIYAAARSERANITQAEIAGAAGVIETTIRRTWKTLAEKLEIKAPEESITTVLEGNTLQVSRGAVKELGLKHGDRVRWSVRGKRLVGEKE